MITGVHVMLFSADPEADRAFFRDVLDLPALDAGRGLVLSSLPPAEMGVYPEGRGGRPATEVTLMTDDLEVTMAELRHRGVQFAGGVDHDAEAGPTTRIRLPGGGTITLYQPMHPTPLQGYPTSQSLSGLRPRGL